MDDSMNEQKRRLLTGTALLGGIAAAGAMGASLAPREAAAQILDSGVDPNSVLAKLRKGATLKVGYSQTPVWFYRDPRNNELQGIYKELVDALMRDLEMTVDWVEVSFANATVGLRRGDFDLYGSSLTYTVPRALVSNYVGPLWSKGSLAIVHKDDAQRFRTVADLNSPDVTFSVSAGASEEQRMPVLFPRARFQAVTGQQVLAAEPVRTKRATVYVTGDSDALALAQRNQNWAHVIDPQNPFDKRPNTWAVRYGDNPWKQFLDMWGAYMTVSGQTQRLYDRYISQLT
ncbi:MAG TPA: transporter substrate-binding domain-containing protein [Falsiroseomonas sp.]|jgi:ABC-type amino acid transport substrate-binding protein|nr:transporter substrate-binding domain-containing protein [Falsiroseomonas sp.]